MRIQLPVETWIEILDWLRRRDLIKKLDKLWASQDGLHVWNKAWEEVPFAEVDMPENTTSFKSIFIRYLDSNVLALLRRMRPLFRNIYLDIYYYADEASTLTALHHLLPMIGEQIGSIDLHSERLQYFSANFRDVLFNARLLYLWDYSSDESELFINWLFTPRKDGQPRILVFRDWETIDDFGTKLRQRFLDPARQLASPFFVRFWTGYVPDSTENIRTGEQLTFKTVEHDGNRYGLVTSCPTKNTNAEWLAEMTEEVLKWDVDNQQQIITLQSPTLGLLDDEEEKPGPETSQTTAAKRMHPVDDDENDDEEASSSGGEATSSTGVKRKKLMSDPKKKEKKANDEETQGLERSERIKKMKQSKKY